MDLKNEKRTSREYSMTDENFPMMKTKYGVVDRNKPDVIYIRSKSRVTPLKEGKNFSRGVDKIKTLFDDNLKKMIKSSSKFSDEYIAVIALSGESMEYGKKSFMNYDIFIRPKFPKKLNENDKAIISIITKINKKLSKSLEKQGFALV